MRARRFIDLWPYALIAFLYLGTSPYHAGLNNPNEMVRAYMTRALAEERTFTIDGVIRKWGMVDDKAIRDGELYSSKAPLQSLVGVPAYAAAAPLLSSLHLEPDKRRVLWVLRIFGSTLFGILFAGVLVAWFRRRAIELGAPRASGTGLGLGVALGTMLYPYSITFTGHLLAAACGGGVYLAAAEALRAPGAERRNTLILLAGALAALTPFAEYPAALIAGPALVALLSSTKGARKRLVALLLLAGGGAIPFVVGLWAHDRMWGSPFKTGYSFLENKGYVEVHKEGFFGITTPKLDAFGGSLFSPGTGLFFFSPILMIGLLWLLYRVASKRPFVIPRSLAVAALAGFALELYFISGHEGWRGGWTVGPRYIIAVAPMLGLFVVEVLAFARLRSIVAAFGALSIVLTGFAAALYPHLSDVYTNPLETFLLASYRRGEMTYGLAHAAGLTGHAANAVHVVPLVAAILVAGLAGAASRVRRSITVAAVLIGGVAGVLAIPEKEPPKAKAENLRLWGFWEPKTPGLEVLPVKGPLRRRHPNLIATARSRWQQIDVARIGPDGTASCRREALQCVYGAESWQRLAPDYLEFGGRREPILFLHPIAGQTVRATIPIHDASRAVLFYGLADKSAESDNPHPIELSLRQADRAVARIEVGNDPGLHTMELTLTSTAPLEIDMEVERDGARVFGFDLELYR